MGAIAGVVGGLAGSAVGLAGGPIGSILGNLIGGIFGGAPIKGPRLGDKSVISSANGTAIPQLFGTVRLAGNLILCAGINEDANTNTTFGIFSGLGGKGLPISLGQKTILYTYHVDMVIAFGRGPAQDVLRIWADGKIIYDKTGRSKRVKKKGFRFRFYAGGEDQPIDPLFEKIVAKQLNRGAGHAPAFRGLCCIVFDRFQLADYANRIPSITAEISFNTVPHQPWAAATLITDGPAGNAPLWGGATGVIDWARQRAYVVQSGSSPQVLRRINLATMAEDAQSELVQPGLSVPFNVMGDGSLLTTANVGSLNFPPLARIDPDTLQVSGLSVYAPYNTIVAAPIGMTGANGRVDFALVISETGQMSVLKWTATPTYLSGPTAVTSLQASIACQGRSLVGVGEAWWVDPDLNVYRVRITQNAAFDAVAGTSSGIENELLVTLSGGGTATALAYVEVDDSVIVLVAGGSKGNRAVKVAADGTLPWTDTKHTVGERTFGHVPSDPSAQHRIEDASFYWFANGTHLYGVNVVTGATLLNGDSWSGVGLPSVDGDQGYDSETNSIVFFTNAGSVGKVIRAYVDRVTGAGVTVGSIVENVCGQVDLPPDDVDTTPLTDLVPGYMVTQPSTARAVIDQLRQGYFFDGVESDYLLKFRKRVGSSVLDLPQADMGVVDQQTGDVFKETRKQEVELPARVTVHYTDSEADYQAGAQTAKRIAAPLPTMHSNDKVEIELPIVMTGLSAKRIATTTAFLADIERASYSTQLPWRYLALDPTDIVTAVMDDGAEFTFRIAKLNAGADRHLELDGIATDVPLYTQTVGASDPTIPGQIVPDAGPTRLFLPDLPLLRDGDDTGGTVSQVYALAAGFGTEGWPGAILFESADAIAYANVATLPSEAAYGIAADALGDVISPWLTDETSSITVRMVTGADRVSSITQLEMLNGANGALIGNEVIQFRAATVNGDESITLSGLLRGRRGTDLQTGGHVTGELFVLLDAATAGSFLIPLGEIGNTRYFKPVTFGAFLEDTPADSRIHHGNDLKPYSVVGQAAALSGSDIDLGWIRRTRIGGAWRDGSGTVPLNEETESYEVDIYDAGAISVLRTLTASTPAATYLAADIASDFGSTPSTLNAAFYQKSAVVGRGFGAIVALPVN